jgi:hypothetical protein
LSLSQIGVLLISGGDCRSAQVVILSRNASQDSMAAEGAGLGAVGHGIGAVAAGPLQGELGSFPPRAAKATKSEGISGREID